MRQLVNTAGAQEAAKRREPRLVRFRAGAHGSELVHVENGSVKAGSFLPEQHGPSHRGPDEQSGQKRQRRRQDEHSCGGSNVDWPLDSRDSQTPLRPFRFGGGAATLGLSCNRNVLRTEDEFSKFMNSEYPKLMNIEEEVDPEKEQERLKRDLERKKKGSSAEFVGKTVFHRRLRRPRCSPSLKASLASSAAAPALTLGCAPRCRLVWAMGNGASGGGSGNRV